MLTPGNLPAGSDLGSDFFLDCMWVEQHLGFGLARSALSRPHTSGRPRFLADREEESLAFQKATPLTSPRGMASL